MHPPHKLKRVNVDGHENMYAWTSLLKIDHLLFIWTSRLMPRLLLRNTCLLKYGLEASDVLGCSHLDLTSIMRIKGGKELIFTFLPFTHPLLFLERLCWKIGPQAHKQFPPSFHDGFQSREKTQEIRPLSTPLISYAAHSTRWFANVVSRVHTTASTSRCSLNHDCCSLACLEHFFSEVSILYYESPTYYDRVI